MRSWHVGGGSAKEDIEDNLETLRKRSRDAYMGIPLAAGAIKTLRTNVVGSGLVPTPQVDADYLHLTEERADHLQAEISREFSLWADSAACDASGMDNFWRLQTLAFTSFLMNGDVFAAVQFKERTNWPYALQLRLIEADQVCSPDRTDRMNPCKVNGVDVHQIVQGVETDKSGAVIAYWVASRHPLAYDNPLPLTWTR
jgi:capsid protein